VIKNFVNLLTMFVVFSFSVSCCHTKIPDISSFADHPFPVESAFFIVHELRIPADEPEDGGQLVASHTGSGAVVRSNTEYSDIITAGHLCDVPTELAMLDDAFLAFDSAGNYYKSILIAIGPSTDLCLLRIKYEKEPLKISRKEPRQGSKVYMAGYPLGVYHPKYLHFFDGYYSGIDYGGNAIWTFPAAPGSSGGVVVNNRGEIVGVVSAVYHDFKHLTIGPGSEQIKMFLREAKKCPDGDICIIE
jgi:S1-C subfamily serine protease